MAAANQIINSQTYIDMIFSEVKYRWPELYYYIINISSNRYGITIPARNLLTKTVQYEGVNNYDGIIKHIEKNEHMIDWWIL